MSKIGKIPVTIPTGVTLVINGQELSITGPKGTLQFSVPEGISVNQNDTQAVVTDPKGNVENKPIFGLTRAQIANMVKGVSLGFEKKLELSGVGYRASLAGTDLQISVGFSHPVKIKAEEGITFSVSENVISITGIDKEIVGNTAARIRAIRPPEPYKGKGILYVGEKVRRKVGKAAKAVGTK